MTVDYHSAKVGKVSSGMDRHKNLIISFPEFIGAKSETIYLFKVKDGPESQRKKT